MKAIQVKFMPCTNTKPTRLKVWAEGNKALIIARDSLDSNDDKPCAQLAAEIFANSLNWLAYDHWNECSRVLVGGMLPNGDHCFCIHLNKVVEIKK
jgi:hypothetical protein